MLIAIDLDEVLAEFTDGYIKHHKQKYGITFQREQFFTYKWKEVLKIPQEEVDKLMNEFHKSKGYKNLKPVRGAINAVKTLAGKHELVVVTARPDSAEKDTRNWLKKHFGNVFSDVFFAKSHYFFQPNKIPKFELCKSLKATFMVEDSLDFAREFHSVETKLLLYDCPWNKNETPKNCQRVFSWEEIVDKIENHE